jgi:osmotically-inducible protein OsmY
MRKGFKKATVALAALILSATVGWAESDDEIRRAVETALRLDARVNADTISVSVFDGHVRLSGTVPSLAAKDAARDAAASVEGVRLVNDAGLSVSAVRTDAEIRESVEARLWLRGTADLSRVTVEVNGGRVTLSGEVDTVTDRFEAERLVQGMDGVTSVVNNLVVSPEAAEPAPITTPGTLP